MWSLCHGHIYSQSFEHLRVLIMACSPTSRAMSWRAVARSPINCLEILLQAEAECVGSQGFPPDPACVAHPIIRKSPSRRATCNVPFKFARTSFGMLSTPNLMFTPWSRLPKVSTFSSSQDRPCKQAISVQFCHPAFICIPDEGVHHDGPTMALVPVAFQQRPRPT